MVCGWEDNSRSGVALRMRHSSDLAVYVGPTYRVNGLRNGDDYAPVESETFTFTYNWCTASKSVARRGPRTHQTENK